VFDVRISKEYEKNQFQTCPDFWIHSLVGSSPPLSGFLMMLHCHWWPYSNLHGYCKTNYYDITNLLLDEGIITVIAKQPHTTQKPGEW